MVALGQLLVARLHRVERHRPFKAQGGAAALAARSAPGPGRSAARAAPGAARSSGSRNASSSRKRAPSRPSGQVGRCHCVSARVCASICPASCPCRSPRRRCRRARAPGRTTNRRSASCGISARGIRPAAGSRAVAGTARRVRIGRVGPRSRRASGHWSLCASHDRGGKPRPPRNRTANEPYRPRRVGRRSLTWERPAGAEMTRQERLRAMLHAAFAPSSLDVADDSADHAGHAGATAAGETHYTVRMVSDAFTGQSRVSRSRAVHDAVAAEFRSGLHALSLTLKTPDEP